MALPKDPDDWLAVRRRTGWKRYQLGRNPTCDYCGQTVMAENATVDHIAPLHHRYPHFCGKDRPSNWALACERCNRRKANLTCAEAGMRPLRLRVCTPECERFMVEDATSSATARRMRRAGLQRAQPGNNAP